MEKWEYKIVLGDDFPLHSREEHFINLGKEGWELVCSTSHQDSIPNFYFKRRIEATYR